MADIRKVKLLGLDVFVRVIDDDADSYQFEDVSIDMEDASGRAIQLKNEMLDRDLFLMLVKKSYVSYSTVVHECWHMFWFVFDYIAGHETLKPVDLGREVYAYVFTAFVNDVLKVLSTKEDSKND